MKWPDGRLYEGEYHAGLPHGRGLEIGADRWKYEGEFELGLRHGHGQLQAPGEPNSQAVEYGHGMLLHPPPGEPAGAPEPQLPLPPQPMTPEPRLPPPPLPLPTRAAAGAAEAAATTQAMPRTPAAAQAAAAPGAAGTCALVAGGANSDADAEESARGPLESAA